MKLACWILSSSVIPTVLQMGSPSCPCRKAHLAENGKGISRGVIDRCIDDDRSIDGAMDDMDICFVEFDQDMCKCGRLILLKL